MNKFEIRTIHHLSASGGTVISKCLASMPEVIFLSEINPLNIEKVRFNPFDPLQQFQAQYQMLSISELESAFLERLKIIVDKCIENKKILILRDHSHSDFLEKEPRNFTPLINFIGVKYTVKSLITLRNPIDSYLPSKKRGWTKGVENSFDEYCKRFLLFVNHYGDSPCFLYEDFVLNPDDILKKMCDCYEIEFDPDYKNNFFNFKLTGNSGRKSRIIAPRSRREYSQELKEEILNSEHFKEISKLYGYGLD